MRSPSASTPPTALDLTALRQRYRDGKAAVLAAIEALPGRSRGVRGWLRRLSRLTDEVLHTLWAHAGLPPTAALVAVGGYGRGELFPYSDVDVLVLLPDGMRPDADPTVQAALERFIGQCWDVGLEIGSSVRTVPECLQEAAADISVQTALLEGRWLAGSRERFGALARAMAEHIDARTFCRAKIFEMQQRHQRYENTPYALEPNCKESPGGLRDLQVILWVAKAAGLGHTWDELARRGLATAREARQLKANEAFLSLIRARLHVIARRREDRLVFDLQTALATSFGIEAEGVGTEGNRELTARRARRASERLMRRYYWAAKAVTQLNQILLLNIQERLERDERGNRQPRRLNERFFDKDGLLEVASDDLYWREPHAILETFLLYQQIPGIKGLSARTLRALYNARAVMNSAFRRDPVNRRTFVQILQQPQGITHAFRLMNQTSVLGRYLWPFRNTVGQMQHDLFHVYTVDQHILMVLRNMRRFFMPEHAHEYPFCSQLAAGWDKPWVLYLAALFHDIGKGRGGDHSERGARDVVVFARQHGLAKEDTELVRFLVAEHLTMSRVAQKEDLSDPAVIEAFARRVGDEHRLTGLYLLTVADIRGTSPKVWNGWKAKLLEDLYRATLRVLGGGAPDPDAEVEARKREALAALALHALPHQAHQSLWSRLDVGYFMRHSADEIAWHTRHLSRALAQTGAAGAGAPTVVRARLSPAGEGLQVLVFTPDQPDLFARICGYFDQAGFSILDAKIHTTADGYALDTFQVTTDTLSEHYRELVAMVENGLPRALDPSTPLPPPGRGRVSRRVRSFPVVPRVQWQPDERGQRWLLSLSAADRKGLLYRIAAVFARHQVQVQLAKVTTLGERVEDTFVVTGPGLHVQREQAQLTQDLLAVLDEP
ncbi:[protein-PII] uridylyltransferase [Tepidimonas taiwanensis]|uniref:Bifunctional uridylyltransferase/uridylyl-removing enzyme n=1 Tax=Tepidimonas taiwanensis TaxID=307486 RepID=A0A554X9R5_9BURK|nr:[protein-PII] uridylyltransferase [Tepidimonas taiwanensis]MCX7692317.1 [protein-PII] uridylyltransferase [Tepidimonas taiwanensis]MDM7462085.1 [protein-PII] uridylyltransferase [Tepidimonas taiwanensis]TSE32558.1 Bifunctional uridylyltransferase/uridylyl-removing enzyme [Tepidimonas taiwanensis]UBQ06451.1 [protein-PII] uridylyltransferase [Tepidimonas taiwanensis]